MPRNARLAPYRASTLQRTGKSHSRTSSSPARSVHRRSKAMKATEIAKNMDDADLARSRPSHEAPHNATRTRMALKDASLMEKYSKPRAPEVAMQPMKLPLRTPAEEMKGRTERRIILVSHRATVDPTKPTHDWKYSPRGYMRRDSGSTSTMENGPYNPNRPPSQPRYHHTLPTARLPSTTPPLTI